MPLIHKLNAFARLSQDDEALIARVAAKRAFVEARQDVVGEGGPAVAIILIESGWACRYRMLEDGRHQIVALLLPGDVCDYNVFVLGKVDHAIAALTPLTVAQISPAGFEELISSHIRLRQALWWDQLVSQAVQREWTVNLGQRSALERLAHFLCEVFYRLRVVGLTRRNSCAFPLTQSELGEATGLSAVHVNRTLQELRSGNLISLKDRTLRIPDLGALEQAALFDDAYLHLGGDGRYLDAS
jgi:CRP-like cAMP-binding protein